MLKSVLNQCIIIVMLLAVAGCQGTPNKSPVANTTADESVAAKVAEAPKPVPLPSAVQQELLPDLLGETSSSRSLLAEKRFDIAAKDVNARDFFASLVKQTPYSIAFHPKVGGVISLQLKQVTLAETLAVVEDLYGYGIRRHGRVLRILPAEIRTETFSFNYLLMERNGSSRTSISSGGISEQGGSSGGNSSSSDSNSSGNQNSGGGSGRNGGGGGSGNGTEISSSTDTNLWEELEKTLTALIEGQGRKVVVSPQSGLVTVKGFPDDIRTVKEYLARSEQHLQRQVILEARIVEVRLSEAFQQGINWSEVVGHIGSTDLAFSTSAGTVGDQVSADLGGVTSISFTNTDFSGVLQLLDTQGDVNVLSSPRIMATNNQKAVIKVGEDEYFVTDVSSTSSSVGNNVVANPEVELTPFFSGIALDVTPQIDESGEVILHVHPSVIDVNEQNKQIEVQGQSFLLPLARSTIRESDTVIKAVSGDVVVIGGLMSSINKQQESKVPILGDIPILGEAFTNKLDFVQKTELVILLRPTVTGGNDQQEQLKRSQSLLKQWHASEQ